MTNDARAQLAVQQLFGGTHAESRLLTPACQPGRL